VAESLEEASYSTTEPGLRLRAFKYDPYDAHLITIENLEAIAEYQGTTFKQGDLMLVRSGYTENLTGRTAEEQNKKLGTARTVGVQGTIEAAEWFWNHQFSAVAGDAVGFESMPPTLPDGSFGTRSDFGICSRFFTILSTRSLTWAFLFLPYSSAFVLPIILRTAYRQALGLERSGRPLQGTCALYIPAHWRTFERVWTGWKPTKRVGALLKGSGHIQV